MATPGPIVIAKKKKKKKSPFLRLYEIHANCMSQSNIVKGKNRICPLFAIPWQGKKGLSHAESTCCHVTYTQYTLQKCRNTFNSAQVDVTCMYLK